MKITKKKKSVRMRGRNMGTHGSGARKNKRKSGNKGGIGMAGSGKRADHKKTKVNKLYGHKYFGKRGITRGGQPKDTRKRINLLDVQNNLEKYGKKTKEGYEVKLLKYKILGTGDVKEKLIIFCLEASKSAIEKVKKAGGEVRIKEKKKIETPLIERYKKKKKV